MILHSFTYMSLRQDFPDGTVVKNLPANAVDMGSIPGLGRSLEGGTGNPLQYSCQENPIDRGTWWATVSGVVKSWTWLSSWAHQREYPLWQSRKTLSSPLLTSIPKITSTEQPVMKKTGIYQNRSSTTKNIKNEPKGGRQNSWYNQLQYPLGGWTTNWRVIVLQRFSHRSESSEPHVRLPSQGVQDLEDPQDHLALKASRAQLQEPHRIGGNRDVTLIKGHTETPTHTRTKGKSVIW